MTKALLSSGVVSTFDAAATPTKHPVGVVGDEQRETGPASWSAVFVFSRGYFVCLAGSVLGVYKVPAQPSLHTREEQIPDRTRRDLGETLPDLT